MLLLLSLAAATAQADVAMIACEPMYVAGILPDAGATGVPTDAVVTALVAGDCGAPPSYDLVLYGPDDVVIAEDRYDGPLFPGDRLTLDPGGLAAGTTYRIAVTPGDGWGQVNETTFTTGDSVASALVGAPTAEFVELTWSRRDAVVSATVEATAAPDAWAGFIEIRDADGAPLAWGPVMLGADDPLWTWFSLQANRAPDEVCVQPFQIRVTGEEIAGDLVCDVPVRARGPLGCSTAASPAGLLPLLLGLLGIRRRS